MSNGLVSVALAVNDEHGNSTNVISAIDIGEDILRIENMYHNPRSPKIEFNYLLNQSGGFSPDRVTGYVKIARRKFDILGYKSWWGNCVWDMVVVTPEVAREMIDYFKTIEAFRADEGEEKFFEKFNSTEPFEWTDYELEMLKMDGWQRP